LLEWRLMQKTRLASVSYLNALPLTWGLIRGRQREHGEVTLAPPHECARLLRDGLVDLALIPSVEFARISGLTPIPGAGVCSRHEVRSVLLMSRTEPAGIRSLAVDSNSRTSVALAQLILRHKYKCRPSVEVMVPDPAAMLESHDAALVIGDAALRASLRLETLHVPHILDLAREWNEMTGLPFVFAFWACRPVLDIAVEKACLIQSLEEGLMNIEVIAQEETQRTGLPAALISSYLRHNIQYRMGREESDSLRVFYRMCREDGLIGGSLRPARAALRP